MLLEQKIVVLYRCVRAIDLEGGRRRDEGFGEAKARDGGEGASTLVKGKVKN